jgi:hypothetical protein
VQGISKVAKSVRQVVKKGDDQPTPGAPRGERRGASNPDGDSGKPAAKDGSALADASAAALRAADNPSSIFIKNKHLASSNIRGGRFATDDVRQAQSVVAEALRSKDAMFLQNQSDGTFRVVADLGRTVGVRGETRIRAVVTNDGRVINAFPVKNR